MKMENVRKISKKYYLRQIVACWLVCYMFFGIPAQVAMATPTNPDQVAGCQRPPAQPAYRQRGNNQTGKHQVHTDQLHRSGYRQRKQDIKQKRTLHTAAGKPGQKDQGIQYGNRQQLLISVLLPPDWLSPNLLSRDISRRLISCNRLSESDMTPSQQVP